MPLDRGGSAIGALLHDLGGFTHSMARGLLDAGCVTIAERVIRRTAERVPHGARILVRWDPHTRYRPRPRVRGTDGFRIVYEDADILVVDKDSGVLSVPTPDSGTISLAERLFATLSARGQRKPQLYAVHRLDRGVSGLLVFARSFEALWGLVPQFDTHVALRQYLAVVAGTMRGDSGTERARLQVNSKGRTVRTTPDPEEGRPAVTHWRVRQRFAGASALTVRLETGRRNQIRVHLAGAGHPVIGDDRYGTASPLIGRPALHAEMLELEHPLQGGRIRFHAPPPDDLRALLDHLEAGGTPADDALRPGARRESLEEDDDLSPETDDFEGPERRPQVALWISREANRIKPPAPPAREILKGRWKKGAPPQRAHRASAPPDEGGRPPRANGKPSGAARRPRGGDRPRGGERTRSGEPARTGERSRTGQAPRGDESRPRNDAKESPGRKPRAAWLKKREADRTDPSIPEWVKKKRNLAAAKKGGGRKRSR